MENQVCIVTGAGSGIGKGIAIRYAKEGAKVAVTDLNLDAANATVKEIEKIGGTSIALPLNVTDEAQVQATVEKVLNKFARLDTMVCNAGVQHIEPVHTLAYADWKKIISVHLDSAFLCTKAALGPMYQQKKGSIIYIGSVHSKTASVLKAPYVSAKHGVLGLCRTVAKEGALHGVRANVICPGFVKTPLVLKQIPEQAQILKISEEDVVKKVMLKDTVDGEFTTIEDVAEVAVLCAGFDTNALTGQSFIVSHGWFME